MAKNTHAFQNDIKHYDKIRDILALRAIGLSVKTIQEFLHGDMSLKEMLHLRKAEIYASIHTKQQEIYLLEENILIIVELILI